MRSSRSRYVGLAIAVGGTVAITPDAALLRLMDYYGGTTAVISVWRFIFTCLFNLIFAAVNQGGLGPLWTGVRSAVGPLVLAALFSSVTNIGFVVSLLKVDPAKALLLISLNPLWAALFGWFALGDELERRTVVAQVLSMVSIALVFMPKLLRALDVGLAEKGDADGSSAEGHEAFSEFYDAVPLVTGMSIAAFLVYSRWCSLNGVSEASLEAAPPLSSIMTSIIAYAMAHSQGVDSLLEGLQPLFWPTLGLDAACIAAYNIALVLAPRHLTGAEVALILLGETLLGPVWVFGIFGVVPSHWTLIGGALLLLTLVGHELAGMSADGSRRGDAQPPSASAVRPADDGEEEDPSYRYQKA